MTEVRIMKLSELRESADRLYGAVSRGRRERAARFVRADDRLRCLAAGYLTEQILPDYSEARFYTGKDGKPCLRDGVPFSLSHGGNYIVLAWQDGADGIGIDVEPIREPEYYRDILPQAMTEKEQKAAGTDAETAVRIWTRKESLYKTVGEGVSGFTELPEVLEDRVLFFGLPCRLRSWEEEGHSFSVAVRGPDEAVELHIQAVSPPEPAR